MADALYVIGNGFDMHHGIRSSYAEFGKYLQATDHATYDRVERYFSVDEMFWAEFEERLASFDIDTLVDDASSFLMGYGNEEWSDSANHDYQFEIDEVVKAISRTMRARFGDWIRQLSIPKPADIATKLVPLDPSATFLNFNYTPSLQRLYGVADSHILHIHGAAADPNAKLVLGHAWVPVPSPPPDEDTDVRVAEGQLLIDQYFQATFKPTERIIIDNAPFFAGLAGVRHILVMGHSVSDVDHPYFEEILRHVQADRVRWKLSYYSDPTPLQEQVAALGIDPALVEYAKLQNF